MYSGGFTTPFYGFASSTYCDRGSFRCEFILIMIPIQTLGRQKQLIVFFLVTAQRRGSSVDIFIVTLHSILDAIGIFANDFLEVRNGTLARFCMNLSPQILRKCSVALSHLTINSVVSSILQWK